MTPEQEQKLLKSLYDRLFDAITYVPEGKAAAFAKETTFVQFSKNEALRSEDFANAMSPTNPQGDQKSAVAFSEMVDQIPNVAANYTPSGRKVSETYKLIVDSANTNNEVDPEQKETYDQAYEFLTQTTEIPNFDGSPTIVPGPTPILQTYNNNEAAYVTAYSGYRAAQNGYNFDNVNDQRAWQAVAPGLQLNIDQTWNQWVQQGKVNVERAQNALQTTINDLTSAAIAAAQAQMRDDRWMSPFGGGDRWILSYALPTDWASTGSGATDFSLSSSYLNETNRSEFTSYEGGASWGAGLWSVGGSFSSSESAEHFHMDAENIEISAKLQYVRIMRPWLNTLIFQLTNWWLQGSAVNAVSNGSLAGNEDSLLPLIPTGFVVASDVKIKGDFSERDESHISKSVSGSARVGWGPFSVGGKYSRTTSEDRLTATYNDGTIGIEGLQILAWISTITSASPPIEES